jgi:hypothetical protein
MSLNAAHRIHMGLAEAGKLLALKGRHAEALVKYRDALRLAHGARAPQIFARHYLHCVLESLEHQGDHLRVAELAGAAADEAANPQPTPFQRRDRAHLLERRGINLAIAGDAAAARDALAAALALDDSLALSRAVIDWLARGWRVDAHRLAQAQARHGYWTVRAETVNHALASEAPLAAGIREMADGR